MQEIGAAGAPRLFVSNRLELLANQLAAVLQSPLSSPLAKELIVVQSKGMERWLSLQLARHHGICANCAFPFPNAVLESIFGAVSAEALETAPFDPEYLTWKIMKILPECCVRSEFSALRAYLRDDPSGLKRFQLAQRVANAFDQYLIFRPRMVLEWEEGKEQHWQAVLWRKLIHQTRGTHRASLREAFFRTLEQTEKSAVTLPERLCVFGISSLPRFHLEVLNRISRLIPVSLFLVNPCREYWGDILSHREARRIRRKYEGREESKHQDLHLEKGNSLLSSLGILGRDFFDLIYTFDFEEADFFEDPGEGNLLSCIQHDIVVLRERGEEAGGKTVLDEADDSIQIHSCHSPMREVEVLHDQLLALFDRDPLLKPEDILVMTPDIGKYAPFIQAVFDTPPADDLRIPYNITDRTMGSESPAARTLIALLDLSQSRLAASAVIAFLESEPVRAAFGLAEPDLELIKHWTEEAGIRWGIDETTRKEQGLPPYRSHSWRFGLERLLLGYALPPGEERTFAGILPFDAVEGDSAATAGKLIDFVENLFRVVTELKEPKTLAGWSRQLKEILARFVSASNESEQDLRVLYRIADEMAEKEVVAGFHDQVSLPVILSSVRQQLDKRTVGAGFMSGGVTFCTLMPMRSIPFAVICLLGMNNDAYPRASLSAGFDLMARHPQPGDRSRRNDDRYLFLEALLSARAKVYVSFVGQSLQDNSVIPPSVVVSELLDYIEAGFSAESGSVTDRIVTPHPLQPFSPRYFRGDRRLFSYSQENHQAAASLSLAKMPAAPFISSTSAPPEEAWRTVSVEALGRFFANPVRHLLRERLDLWLETSSSIIPDKEPLDLRGLDRYSLNQKLLEKCLAGVNLEEYCAVAKASGMVPPGTIGECLYGETSRGVSRFAALIKELARDGAPEDCAVDVRVGPFSVVGTIKAVFPAGLIRYRYAEARPRDYLAGWIHHLVLSCAGRPDAAGQTFFLGLHDGCPMIHRFPPLAPERGEALVRALLETYWRGLSQPLHFFPKSSWKYAEGVMLKNKSDDDAMADAVKAWEGTDFQEGELDDPYYRRCFGETNPLDDSFQDLARQILGPLLNDREDYVVEKAVNS